MLELQEQHMINQEYILPFPYLCQIYHLLNLKHLETIHNFSLNNLKVITINYFQPQLSEEWSNFKQLRFSSQCSENLKPIVEAVLILHTPIL